MPPDPLVKAVSDRMVLPLTNGSLAISLAFYRAEVTLWKDGGAAGFFMMLAKRATNKLNDAGAIEPYVFECAGTDGNVSPLVFKAREM